MLMQMPNDDRFTLGEAARAIGVSQDALRRWEQAGKLRTERDERNRRLVPVDEVLRLRRQPDRHRTGSELSARNRFPGRAASVEIDGAMALVEIEAGPFRATAAVARAPVPELRPRPGGPVTAPV